MLCWLEKYFGLCRKIIWLSRYTRELGNKVIYWIQTLVGWCMKSHTENHRTFEWEILGIICLSLVLQIRELASRKCQSQYLTRRLNSQPGLSALFFLVLICAFLPHLLSSPLSPSLPPFFPSFLPFNLKPSQSTCNVWGPILGTRNPKEVRYKHLKIIREKQ